MIAALGSLNSALHHVPELSFGLTGIAQAQLILIFGQINI